MLDSSQEQNRFGFQADLRNHLNLQIGLLAEKEMTLVLRELRAIGAQLGISTTEARRSDAWRADLEVDELLTQIEQEIPPESRHERRPCGRSSRHWYSSCS